MSSAPGTASVQVQGGDPVDPPAPSAPVISGFTADPATVAPGQGCTLSWSVSGATQLTLVPGVGTVTGTSAVVNPTATTTYTLEAGNAAGSVSASVTVTVTVPPQPPVITSFTASPVPGGWPSSILAWSVTGATSLRLEPGIGNVTGIVSLIVRPAGPTGYTLTATNAAGQTTATVKVPAN